MGSNIDPPIARIFGAGAAAPPAAVPAPDDHAARRAAANATMLILHRPPGPEVAVAEYDVAVAGAVITVRVTRPLTFEAGVAAPTVFFIHGGGWYQGNLDTGEVESGPLAVDVPCQVVSVDYRLAPEHPFPVPLDDCVAAYRWMLTNAADLGVDTNRIVIAGTSAGGNLAAALCLVAKRDGLTMPVAQLLDAPALDLTMGSPSVTEMGTGAGLTADGLREYARHYIGEADPHDPLLSPLLAEDLSGLPAAVVIVAEYDPVRDDGERWVRALHGADVPACGIRVLAHFHGGWIIPVTTTFNLVQDLRMNAVRRAFDGTLSPGF